MKHLRPHRTSAFPIHIHQNLQYHPKMENLPHNCERGGGLIGIRARGTKMFSCFDTVNYWGEGEIQFVVNNNNQLSYDQVAFVLLLINVIKNDVQLMNALSVASTLKVGDLDDKTHNLVPTLDYGDIDHIMNEALPSVIFKKIACRPKYGERGTRGYAS